MDDPKPLSTPLSSHIKSITKKCPTSIEAIFFLSKTPYSSIVGSLMYVMVCTHYAISHSVGLVSGFLTNPNKEHCNEIKWI
jgi:hypothetical protein